MLDKLEEETGAVLYDITGVMISVPGSVCYRYTVTDDDA